MGALDGIRVVELASERAALAGKMLADSGAEVWVVEPPGGHATRCYGPFANDEPGAERSLWWWYYNTSKHGLSLDLEQAEGRELFAELIADADVLLEAEDPGVMKRWGLDYESLQASHPKLVMVSVTPFAADGPRAGEAATDLTLLSGGGPVWSCGYDDHSLPPVRGGGNQAQHTASLFATASLLVALLEREQSGQGQHVAVDMHAAANVTTEMATYHWLVGQGTVQRLTGRHASEQPTLGTQIRCADGTYVTTGVPPRKPREFGLLLEWLRELDLEKELPEAVFLEQASQRETFTLALLSIDDETLAFLGAAREALNLIASKVSAYQFFEGAQQRNIPVGIIYSPEEVMEDPHFVARGFPVEVEHEELGRSVRYPGAPWVFHGSPWELRARAPRVGEHNEAAFDALGVSERRRKALRESGVV